MKKIIFFTALCLLPLLSMAMNSESTPSNTADEVAMAILLRSITKTPKTTESTLETVVAKPIREIQYVSEFLPYYAEDIRFWRHFPGAGTVPR